MALKYAEVTKWVTPTEKLEGEPVVIPCPKDLPPLNPKLVKTLEVAETQHCYWYCKPATPVFDASLGRYVAEIEATPLQNSIKQNDLVFLTDEKRFVETKAGVFSLKDGNQKKQVTSARIRVIGLKRLWHTEKEFTELFDCRVYCSDVWGDEPRNIVIEKDNYKNLFQKIHKEYPAVFLLTADCETLEAYLTKVFPAEDEILTENVSDKIGWLTINGQTDYYIGANTYYNGFELPNITICNKEYAFWEGFSFLNVGNFNREICILWLFSHLSYSIYWFEKANVNFRSILFLKGATNLFKTTVVSVLANIFRLDREKALIRLNSTRASLQEYLSKSQDSLACIDDFSNTVGANNKEMVKNAEFVIRAVGDGQFPAKMMTNNHSKIKDTNIRCTVVVTGEEEFGLSLSSNYRMITLKIVEGTFNPEVLANYQNDPSILRNYFAVYIQFLKENYSWIINHCNSQASFYRTEFRNLEVPRFINVAVALSLQVDILRQFASYCGINAEMGKFVFSHLQNFYGVIFNVLQQNQVSSSTGKPEIRFVKALMQSLGTDKSNGLANDDKSYLEDMTKFIGFWDKQKNQIWVRFEDIYALVRNYYSMLGEQFMTNEKTLKEILVRQGIADGKEGQYLRRITKGGSGNRKYMLVLNMNKIYEIYEKINEEEEV